MSGYSQIVYRVGFQEAYHHVIEAELLVRPEPEVGASKTETLGFAPQVQLSENTVEGGSETQGLELVFPVWTPGGSIVRVHAKHRNAHCLRVDRYRWRIDSPAGVAAPAENRFSIARPTQPSTVCVRYRLYCREMSVRTNWVEKITDF